MNLAHFGYSVIPELARGVTTALAVWAVPPAAPCPALACQPTLNCPEGFPCPSCTCQGNERHCPPIPSCHPYNSFAIGVVFGIIATLVVVCIIPAVLSSAGGFVKGYFVHLFARTARLPISASAAPTRLSAAQIALARRRQLTDSDPLALETF